MFKFPRHGFAKRVDDTVERAMAIIRKKESMSAAQSQGSSPAQTPRGGRSAGS